MTYLVVPIAAENPDNASKQIASAKAAGAEMLELRLDYLQNLSVLMVKKLIGQIKADSTKKFPLIVTCRDKAQGGAKEYPLKLRLEVLTAALDAGAEFIDFEYENFLAANSQDKIRLALSKSLKGRLILSAHNFETRFENITKLYRRITTVYSAAIAKLVYTANHINDCFEAFDLLHRTSGERIILCMGKAGTISRIIAKKLNSFVTFASIDNQNTTAPGQLTIGQFKKLYRCDDIRPDTDLYGVIGSPVAHSLSPHVHNAAFADIGVNKLYLPLNVEGDQQQFNRFMDNIVNRSWLGFKGFSVTIPHKQNALNYISAKNGVLEPLAEKIGAVNTILITADGVLKAFNTDYAGALDAVTSKLKIERSDLKDLPVAVTGAGGVARAIVAGLSDAGARVRIYNRTTEKGEKLADDFGCDF